MRLYSFSIRGEMAVTHKIVVKMAWTTRLELRELVARLSQEYHDQFGRLTQSAAVEAALYYWLRQATLDEQRAAFREVEGERTTAVTFQLTNESDLKAACGGELAVERIRAGLSYPSQKDMLRAVIKCLADAPEDRRLNALSVVRGVGPVVDIGTAPGEAHRSRQLEQEASEDGSGAV